MTFKKGHDARRYVPVNKGLTEFHKQLGGLLRERSLEAVDFMLATMRNDENDPKLRFAAAKEMLDRGLGRPVDRTVIASLDAESNVAPADLTDAELLQMIANNRPKKERIINQD